DRTLEVRLKFHSPSPLVHTVYHDPLLQADSMGQPEPAADGLRESSPVEDSLPAETAPEEIQDRQPTLQSKIRNAFRALFSSDFWLRPSSITAVLALFVVIALFAYLHRAPSAPLTARAVLAQAVSAEAALAARTDQVLHRVINLDVSEPG